MSFVEYKQADGVGVILVNNPPVNALSVGVPREIAEHVDKALGDAGIDAIVIAGAGRGFIAGADIKMLGKPWPDGEPNLRDLIRVCERSTKPVIAAIHGNALGGGLELAMGCHYRVAAPDARLGQPEVKLGFPPGAGGTQRLPRLVGVEKALDMIVSGDPIGATEAHELGLVDQLIAGDLVAGACDFACALTGSAMPVRERDIPSFDTDVFAALEQRISRRTRGQRAPGAGIECVRAATELPFDEGILREREIFEQCVASDESKALRHLFFAQRNISKVPGVSKDTPRREIASAAVIGAGTMGGGIAMCFANAGIPVTLVEQEQAALEHGFGVIEKNYAATVGKGRLSESDKRERLALIRPVLNMQEVAGADLVVEAVFEEMPIKLEVFRALNGICKPGAILASNTSYLDVNAIAGATGREGNVLGMHFFSPANVMRLLEIVRTDTCSAETLATVLDLARRLGKVGVVAGVCHGFIGNRMLEGYLREAEFLLQEGATPQQIDKVITDFGFAMGPLAVCDLAGLDIGWRKRKAQAATRDPALRYSVVADRLCEQGRFGQKTGAGYYRYESGDRAPVSDPQVEALILESAEEAGIERRDISDQEILERCLYPLINEGARVLDEGIAIRASDIDVVWINGYGFPTRRGGPMFYADTVGVGKVHDAVCKYHERHGAWWKPSGALARIAASGGSFGEE